MSGRQRRTRTTYMARTARNRILNAIDERHKQLTALSNYRPVDRAIFAALAGVFLFDY
jgi:hypothetical protein